MDGNTVVCLPHGPSRMFSFTANDTFLFGENK